MTDWKRFEGTETEVLIDHFQNESKDESIRDHAFLAICFRVRKDLLKKCESICRNRGYDVDVAQDIVETTLKNYGKSGKFKYKKDDQFSIDDAFKVYLYRIARNELNDYYRLQEKRKNGQFYDGTEGIVTNIPNINVHELDKESQVIHETLMSLPYSHQVIYLTYMMHEKEGVNLPRTLQAKLRKHLGDIKQDTVRFYKKQAIDKIEAARKVITTLKMES